MLLNQAQYAEHRKRRGLPGATAMAVSKAVHSRRITIQNGLIDPAVADIEWARNTRAIPIKPTTESPAAAQPELSPAARFLASQPPAPGTLAHAQLVHETAKAREAGLRAQRLEGTVVSKKDVEATWSQFITGIRSLFLLLPDDVAPRIAPVTDVLECRDILMRAVNGILTKAADFPDSYNSAL